MISNAYIIQIFHGIIYRILEKYVLKDLWKETWRKINCYVYEFTLPSNYILPKGNQYFECLSSVDDSIIYNVKMFVKRQLCVHISKFHKILHF